MGLHTHNALSRIISHKAAIFFVLAAYLLRAFVPAGWMPAATAGEAGNFIVICTLSGLKSIEVDSNGKPLNEEAPHDSNDDGKTCAFGTAPKLALAGVDIIGASPDAAYALRARLRQAPVPKTGGLHATYAPRAPPSFI
nr:MAG: hypothetical protein E4H34_05910 [Hyphomicrobiales bacterium]